MKAIRIHSYGGPEVLVYEVAPIPMIGADEVLVKVHAAALNPIDRFTRAGYLHETAKFTLPLIPGMDLSGVISAIGAQVTSMAVGDEVYGYSNMMRQGAYAEYAIVSAPEIAPKPSTIDHVAAAAIPLAGLSAWQALEAVGLRSGQTILIHGAGGGVGTFAIQLAAQRGARVLATASPGKAELVRQLGATQVVDYTTTRIEEVVQDVDVVLDTIGGEVLERSWGLLKRGGVLVTVAGQVDPSAAEARGVRGISLMTQSVAADLSEVARLVDAGLVKPIVSDVFPLAQASAAHELLERGHTIGKTVLSVTEQSV